MIRAWLVGLGSAALWLAAPGWAQDEAKPERDLNQPIVFGTAEAFYPYSFRDADGQLKGFGVDLADAVARTMRLRTQTVALPNMALTEALQRGRIDVVKFWTETDERRTWAGFSVPILRFETVAVVRKDDQRIRRLADLKGRRVTVGPKGSVTSHYLATEQPEAILILAETSEEAMRMLSASQIDAALMSRLTARSLIDRLGLDNLRVLDDRIPGDKYDVRFGFAVRKGDALLLARLNEGLAILHRTGEFERIYHQWFGRYEATTFTREEVITYVAAALALACVAATWGFLRQRTLSRRIAKQAAELAEQRSLLAALHDHHPLATVMLEIPARGPAVLASLNHEAARLFGLDRAAAPGRRMDELRLPADLQAYFRGIIERWRTTGQAGQWETRLPATQQLLETALVPLGAAASGAQRLCVLSSDVTKRRLMDQELAQSRRLRALGELVGGIAHEFNNLLTPIIMTTGLVRATHANDPVLQADLGVIDQAATRAAALTRRLLAFGRKSDERAQPVRLADAVENCFALLRATVDRRVEWVSSLPPDLPPILFNPTDLNQVVFNLVLNARDSLLEKLAQSSDGGWTPRLHVHARELPATAQPSRNAGPGRALAAWQQLTVEDNGLGIPPEIADRIFEPFFTTKEVGKGTGLGLTTVWHLVTEASGEVRVESKLGEGTKFHLMLPRWRDEAAAPKIAPAARAAPASAARCRILLVEDEPLVARSAVLALEGFGHSVTHLLDGAEAWSHLSSVGGAPYDALLLDVNMPRMNGVDLVRRLRNTAFAGRIIVMSGRVAGEDMRALKNLRVDRILTKPFTPAELVEALRAAPAATGAAPAMTPRGA